MVKNFIICVSIICGFLYSFEGFAQPFSSMSQAKSYFDRNRTELNNIEGIYILTIDGAFRSSSIYFRDRQFTNEYTVAIVSSPIKSTYYVYDTNKPTMMDCKIVHQGGNYYSYVKLGESSWEKLFSITSYDSFSVYYSKSDGGASIRFLNTFKKIYPTQESIERNKSEKNTQELSSTWSGSGFALKDGYIGVKFDIACFDASLSETISYNVLNKSVNNAPNTTQWDYEGYLGFSNPTQPINQDSSLRLQLENGIWVIDNQDTYNFVRGTVLLYDIDARAADDIQ